MNGKKKTADDKTASVGQTPEDGVKVVESAADETAIKVSGLFKKYARNKNYAVKDIGFECKKGEIVGLLGHNGAGKSTTLKCLTGMLPFDDGEIRICGDSIKGDGLRAKKHFGFVTDNHAVFVKMTGLEYLSFIADVYNVPSKVRAGRIEELQAVFGLGNKIENLISSYSHGMKQKICMMGSLIHDPEVWILDEPMVGLDPGTTLAVGEYMKAFAAEGKTILFSTHNLDAVRRLCDRAVVIKNGMVEADLLINGQDDDYLDRFFTSDEGDRTPQRFAVGVPFRVKESVKL